MPDLFECRFCERPCTRGLVVALEDGTWRCKSGDACQKRVRARERAANAGRCVDCVAEGVKTDRKLAVDAKGELRPGPRCVTHWRARRKVVRHQGHAKRIEKNYGLTGEQYWTLYAAQGGKCFGCQRATGATKRLAVDHDHQLALEHGHDPKQGCPRCVRALLCGQCNQIIGRLGVEALLRLIQVLTNPPARRMLVAAVEVVDDDCFSPT